MSWMRVRSVRWLDDAACVLSERGLNLLATNCDRHTFAAAYGLDLCACMLSDPLHLQRIDLAQRHQDLVYILVVLSISLHIGARRSAVVSLSAS